MSEYRAAVVIRMADEKLGTAYYRMNFDPTLLGVVVSQMMEQDLDGVTLYEGLIMIDTIDKEDYERVKANPATTRI